MSRPAISRRQFLAAMAASAISLESTRGFAANDTLNVACIGTGGRCRRLMGRLATVPNVRLAAVCDIWDVHLAKGAELADAKAIREATDYHRLLERDDIDAVMNSTPDHWHVPISLAAVRRGKHVSCEKPLTLSVAK